MKREVKRLEQQLTHRQNEAKQNEEVLGSLNQELCKLQADLRETKDKLSEAVDNEGTLKTQLKERENKVRLIEIVYCQQTCSFKVVFSFYVLLLVLIYASDETFCH